MAKASTKGAKGRAMPARVENVLSSTGGGIELHFKVSEKDGIQSYGFSYGGVPVPKSNDEGVFFAQAGISKKLEWGMVGNPGGSMKVTVTRDGTKIKEREKSTIPPPLGVGYDYFTITVS